MTGEESVLEELLKNLSFLEGKVKITRPRRMVVDVDIQRFKEAFNFLVNNMKFNFLLSIVGLDEPDGFGVIYNLAQEKQLVLSLKTKIKKENPLIDTVTAVFPCADCYERELVDLLGIKVQGLEPGNRYPLPDNWPKDEFPLRKDWKPKSA